MLHAATCSRMGMWLQQQGCCTMTAACHTCMCSNVAVSSRSSHEGLKERSATVTVGLGGGRNTGQHLFKRLYLVVPRGSSAGPSTTHHTTCHNQSGSRKPPSLIPSGHRLLNVRLNVSLGLRFSLAAQIHALSATHQSASCNKVLRRDGQK